ncbi:MAG TPA: hypothetical protein VGO63_01700 [Candidatus Paceibacterota bacterium]|jgi:hypothetical protein|nr:hypothetical protein [Candidatus Paceibacterota bacterium]
MDNMFGNDQNLKDTGGNSLKDTFSAPVPYKNTDTFFVHYPKLGKLITALYMVTDIMDKGEPVRLKLRTFGTEILSDIHSASRTELNQKIQTLLSFLDIALAVSLVSEMNFSILKKEFIELSQSLAESKEYREPTPVNHIWLEEFLKPEQSLGKPEMKIPQKGKDASSIPGQAKDSNTSKKQRRDEIIQAIRDNGNNATITDVKLKASGSLVACGEKTLQRELIAMVKDGILDKTGEKRWSKYYVH